MASVLDHIKHYQHGIEKYSRDEPKVLKCIDRLFHLDVTVQHLQETGVGRTVNALRKEPGNVGTAARALVNKWKLMVAAEENSEPEDHNQESTNYNGHGHGRDSDDNLKQSRNGGDSSGHTSSRPPKETDHKQMNGHHSNSKRKNESSEDSGPDTKKSRNLLEENDVKIKTESQSDSDQSDSNSDESESSESSDEDKKQVVKIKTEPPDEYHSSSSSRNIDIDLSIVKKEPKDSSSNRSDESKHYNTDKQSSSESKSASKNHLSSSHRSSKDKENSEKKHRSEHKSSDKERSSSSKHSSGSEKHRSSSEKHNSSSEKHANSSEKHKSRSNKHESKSEKHKSSSHSSKSEKDKSKSTDKHKSEKSSHSKEKQSSSSSKSKDMSSSPSKLKDTSTSSVKSKDSSSSKDKSSHSKSEKRHSSSSDKSKSRTDKISDSEKDSKHRSSSSHKKSSSSKANNDEPKKKKSQSEDSDDGIDCGSGASFAEALGMVVSPSKPKKKVQSGSKELTSPLSNFECQDLGIASLLAPTTRLAPLPPLDIEISALPEISPNYRPRPPPKLLPHFTDEDAMSHSISSKNQRTKVYSGVKTYGKVPTLYEACVQVLQEHIEALEYTGGVPYEILKPVVDKATPQQLFMLEHYNPYLMEDTDHLWQKFCEKNFRSMKRQEMETWREMYMRCQEEQESKLRSLTANIKMTQEAKKAPIKQTKMAYVDTVVKPPRNIARKQALHGTARAASASPAARVASLSSAPNVLRAGVSRAASIAVPSTAFVRPKKAPLMQKALQFLRGRKR